MRCPKCDLQLDSSMPICPNDGTRLSNDIERGQFFNGRYQVIERLAAGGMGVAETDERNRTGEESTQTKEPPHFIRRHYLLLSGSDKTVN